MKCRRHGIFIEDIINNHQDDLSEMLSISLKSEEEKMDVFGSINVSPLRGRVL